MCGLIGRHAGSDMRGVVFAESANFEPREAFAWLSPDVGGPLPATAQEVLSVAQRQLRFVRSRYYPEATGRRSPSPRRRGQDRHKVGPAAHRR